MWAICPNVIVNIFTGVSTLSDQYFSMTSFHLFVTIRSCLLIDKNSDWFANWSFWLIREPIHWKAFSSQLNILEQKKTWKTYSLEKFQNF